MADRLELTSTSLFLLVDGTDHLLLAAQAAVATVAATARSSVTKPTATTISVALIGDSTSTVTEG
jgi:hypothetical protein